MNNYISAGRKTILVITFILLIDTLFYYITENTLSPASKLLRFSFSVVLLIFIYRGHTWARWLTGILLIINSLLCVLRFFFVFPNLGETLYSILFVFLYGIIGFVLIKSQSIKEFSKFQRSRS